MRAVQLVAKIGQDRAAVGHQPRAAGCIAGCTDRREVERAESHVRAVVDRGLHRRATFGRIPADAIALSVQAPRGWYDEARLASLVLLAFVVIGGGFGVAVRSRARARKLAGAGRIPSALAAIARAATWSIACCSAGMLAIFGPDHVLPGGPVRHYGYGHGFAVLLVVLARWSCFRSASASCVSRRARCMPRWHRDPAATSSRTGLR
jgi:hypothetical protein